MLACDQLVRQYVMWEKIIACIKSLAASGVRYGFMCLILARLNLIVLDTFFYMFFK